jgi:hypothetical protein
MYLFIFFLKRIFFKFEFLLNIKNVEKRYHIYNKNLIHDNYLMISNFKEGIHNLKVFFI